MNNAIYESDRLAWATSQAKLLRSGQLDILDIDHLAEELESIMGNERRELYKRLRVLIGHLLKWKYQPENRSKSWEGTIRVQRKDLARLFKESPSLRRFLPEETRDAYADAVELACLETGISESEFPESCPFSEAEMLEKEFWPD